MVGLPGADLGRAPFREAEVGTELSLFHFGIYFGHFQRVVLALAGEVGGKLAVKRM